MQADGSLFQPGIMFEVISVSTFQGDLSSIVKCQDLARFISQQNKAVLLLLSLEMFS